MPHETARRFRRWRRRRLIHPLQGLLAWSLYTALRPLPIAWASGIGAGLGRLAGLLAWGAAQRVGANLRHLRPDQNVAAIRRETRALWAHLGRTIAEYAVLDRLWDAGRVEVSGVEAAMARATGRPLIFFSGHLGNWELAPAAAVRLGYPVRVIYRPPSNPVVAPLLLRIRERCGVTMLPKTMAGARAAHEGLRQGLPLGFLVDEKTVRGVPLPALGRPTRAEATAVVNLARFALRSGAAVVPIRVTRLAGCRFRLDVCAPILPDPAAPPPAETDRIVAEVDALLGAWVRETPAQWLWLTQRLFPD
ncbi:MAG: hypothetical protein GVY09_08275 [Gammaproteobacteria bacterium]|jgi:KDO2-lipid IV(A) lauroyltransferase|nr:hypothetical protein [Gammaproteobacteria bacterium]